MSYLEEAAALLRKAAVSDEKRFVDPFDQRHLNESRERIAMKFAQLGAIERGLIPTDMIHDLLTAIREAGVR